MNQIEILTKPPTPKAVESRAMAQAVSRRPLTAEVSGSIPVQSICGGQSGTGQVSLLVSFKQFVTLIFIYHRHYLVVSLVTRLRAGRSAHKRSLSRPEPPDHACCPATLRMPSHSPLPFQGIRRLRHSANLHLVQRLRISGAIRLLHHPPSWRAHGEV